MATHNTTGQIGEALAANWFINKGYTILHQNWRYKNLEVDIIASKQQMLHFIEVKSTTTIQYGHPENNVSPKKITNLINASAQYLYLYPQWQRIQFDVLAITMLANTEIAYYLIEDVYE